MRGEDAGQLIGTFADTGSPPHARGRPFDSDVSDWSSGITPACAGKTRPRVRRRTWNWDHPRMRGEDVRWIGGICSACGSPPHARGRPGSTGGGKEFWRITPACAGKTGTRRSEGQPQPDHPRMRGED